MFLAVNSVDVNTVFKHVRDSLVAIKTDSAAVQIDTCLKVLQSNLNNFNYFPIIKEYWEKEQKQNEFKTQKLKPAYLLPSFKHLLSQYSLLAAKQFLLANDCQQLLTITPQESATAEDKLIEVLNVTSNHSAPLIDGLLSMTPETARTLAPQMYDFLAKEVKTLPFTENL